MPTPSTPTHPAGAQPAPDRAALPNWLREPLLHFIVLGALLFAVDHFLVARSDDPRTIVVGAEVDSEARKLFKASRGVDPTAEELAALRQVWLDNEVLYREGLALAVDRGDTAIRERVIFKSLSVIDANVKLPPFDDKLLRQWFEGHRVKYDEPARFDFQEAVIDGETSETAVRAFVQTLNLGTPGDAKVSLRVFKGRPHANLVQSYGADFAKSLEESTLGEWRAHATKEGWRAMRLESITAPKPAVFESLRGIVQLDWTDATLSQQRSAAVRALTKKYRISTPEAAK